MLSLAINEWECGQGWWENERQRHGKTDEQTNWWHNLAYYSGLTSYDPVRKETTNNEGEKTPSHHICTNEYKYRSRTLFEMNSVHNYICCVNNRHSNKVTRATRRLPNPQFYQRNEQKKNFAYNVHSTTSSQYTLISFISPLTLSYFLWRSLAFFLRSTFCASPRHLPQDVPISDVLLHKINKH